MKKRLDRYKWLILALAGIALIVLSANEAEIVELLIVLYFAAIFFVALREIVILIKIRNERSKTELLHLKSQVNPHFFFNMLNNLYGLVETDAKQAQVLILKLSEMMRYSIYEGQQDLVTLNEEIAYLKNYIELHQMRYHKKIAIQFHIDQDDEHYKIMPLLLIMLVENAFKHGVENLRANAYVHISLTATNNQLNFTVDNNFDPVELPETSGIGLKNLQRRLEIVYPSKHAYAVSIKEDNYQAKLQLAL